MMFKKENYLLISALVLGLVTACDRGVPDMKSSPSTIFAVPWNSGLYEQEPAFHSQQINSDTIVIRQSLKTTFEAPFLYLIFGDEKVLLIDSGVKGVDLRAEVDRQINAWLSASGRQTISLIVMHTHGHGDHVGGDAAFKNRPDTVIVGHKPEDVAQFFSIESWPTDIVSFDLGGRTVHIIPTPGHHDSHIMIFDPATKILFSGDAIYPGRLYFKHDKADEYKASIDRLAEFSRKNDVRWLLGAHIEMATAPGRTLPGDRTGRPDEHLLELPPSVIAEIRDAFKTMDNPPRITHYDEFVLYPLPEK